MAIQGSPINLDMPATSSLLDTNTRDEMQKAYNAIRILLQALDAANVRIAALEAYNIAHP